MVKEIGRPRGGAVTLILHEMFDNSRQVVKHRINCHHVKVDGNLFIIYGIDRKYGHDKILRTNDFIEIEILHHGMEDTP
ncbi:MAG: hypothetical protein M0P69_09350 [Bacteroidales bacterium]|nr:hypothetical protein [Bacteroidales bacterium]